MLGDENTKPVLKGLLAAVLFSAAWWIWIDAYTYTRQVLSPEEVKGTKLDIGWMAGIISTLGLTMVNMVPGELLGSSGFSYGEGGEGRARLCFVVSLMMTFGGLTAAIIIMTSNYVNMGIDYIAAAIIVQNVLILISSLVLRMQFGDGGEW